MYNWLSTTHRTTITKKFATLLFQIGMKRKLKLGKLVFEHIQGHVENVTYRKALGYPFLIFRILIEQKSVIVTLTKILRPPTSKLRISHKLYERHHLRDVPSRKKQASQEGKLKGKVLDGLKSRPSIASTS